MTRLLIAGAGGFGREAASYVAEALPHAAFGGFLDDNPRALDGTARAGQVVAPLAGFVPGADDQLLVAVASPAAQQRIVAALTDAGARFATLVHPRAYVSPEAEVGEGSIIAPFAFIGPGARLAPFAVVNVGAMVGHDVQVGRHAVISPHATLNGWSVLESRAFLGAHAAVLQFKRVGEGAQVAAGAVVYHDVPAGFLAVGNPAKARAVPVPG